MNPILTLIERPPVRLPQHGPEVSRGSRSIPVASVRLESAIKFYVGQSCILLSRAMILADRSFPLFFLLVPGEDSNDSSRPGARCRRQRVFAPRKSMCRGSVSTSKYSNNSLHLRTRRY